MGDSLGSVRWNVKGIPLLADAGASSLEIARQYGVFTHHARESILLQVGEQPTLLRLVVAGRVGCYSLISRPTLVSLHHAPCVVGLAAAFEGAPSPVMAICRSEVVSFTLPAQVILTAATTDLALQRALLRYLAQDGQGHLRRLLELRERDTAVRLGCWLERLFQHRGNPDRIALPMQKAELAERLGMTPASITRAFTLAARYGFTMDDRAVHRVVGPGVHPLPMVDYLDGPLSAELPQGDDWLRRRRFVNQLDGSPGEPDDGRAGPDGTQEIDRAD